MQISGRGAAAQKSSAAHDLGPVVKSWEMWSEKALKNLNRAKGVEPTGVISPRPGGELVQDFESALKQAGDNPGPVESLESDERQGSERLPEGSWDRWPRRRGATTRGATDYNRLQTSRRRTRQKNSDRRAHLRGHGTLEKSGQFSAVGPVGPRRNSEGEQS